MESNVSKGTIIKTIVLSALSLGLVFAAEVAGALLSIWLAPDADSLITSIGPEVAGALVAFVCVWFLGGRHFVAFSWRDMSYTFRFGWWCLVVSLGFLVIEVFSSVSEGTPVAVDWPAKVAGVTLLCAGVGVLEEFVFRGLIFQSLLATMGRTHKGVVCAILITSLCFGIAHVDLAEDFVDALSTLQAVLKIIQTGMYSFLLCVIVLRTKQLGGVSAFHGFDDWLLLVVSTGFFSESFDTDYVQSGEEGVMTALLYVVVICLYLPFMVKAVRELRRGRDVTRGCFIEHDLSRSAGMPQMSDAPVVPQGLPGAETALAQQVPSQPVDSWTVESVQPLPPVPTVPQVRSSVPVAQPSPQRYSFEHGPVAAPAQGVPVPPVGVAPARPSAPGAIASKQDSPVRHTGRPPAPTGL